MPSLGSVLRPLARFLAIDSLKERDIPESKNTVLETCGKIAAVISPGKVFYPGSSNYISDNLHSAVTSSQESVCSVEPANAEDVSAILKLVGSSGVPFAVKSGGHATNPKFSSTSGVMISMTRISNIDYDPLSMSVNVGTGAFWDDVYATLQPHNVNVVGARATGVGVGGFALGGGYGFNTNQYGLALDNVLAYELVTPDARIVNVTAESDLELFSGLKGTLNNFGIVTKMVLGTHPQGPVWGGPIAYSADQFPAFLEATRVFCANTTDPKAAGVPTFVAVMGAVSPGVMLFYDGPAPPDGVFNMFLDIPNLSQDTKIRTYKEVVAAFSLGGAFDGTRYMWHTVPVSGYTKPILETMLEQVTKFAPLTNIKGSTYGIAAEPFLPSAFQHAKVPTAYPPQSAREAGLTPLGLALTWPADRADLDEEYASALRQSADKITEVALQEGKTFIHAALYPNYAIFGTKLQDLYSENLEKLRRLKKRVDPKNVMGNTGGWKL